MYSMVDEASKTKDVANVPSLDTSGETKEGSHCVAKPDNVFLW